MCGIVGYVGEKGAVKIVLEGLKRLEYRGYDSSGICFKDKSGQLKLYKKTGKLKNLVSFIQDKITDSHACIGHTRWATHGEVSDSNAHPHISDSIINDYKYPFAIVHNGIIENARELKKELENYGLSFSTETDSEVFLGLLIVELDKGSKILKAIADAFKKIDGNSAFVIQARETEEIFAIKRAAPIVCGLNSSNRDLLVSSDPYALAGVVDQIYFPEDEIICCLDPKHDDLLTFFDLDLNRSEKYLKQSRDMDYQISEKGHYEHFMLKEIHEQPGLIRELIKYYFKGDGANALEIVKNEKEPERIHIVACGSAWHAGLVIRNFLESYNRIHCGVELASEFRYRNPLIKEKDVGLFISQSGETADTNAAQILCKNKGIRTFSIVNVEGSTLYRNCDQNLLTMAGTEIGVASTKAFTQQMLTGYITCHYLLEKDVNSDKIISKMDLLSKRIESILHRSQEIQEIAEKIYSQNGFIFTGRGQYFPVALEGALKLKEIAYVHAEGYAAGELKHGPIALIDEEMVNIAIVGPELYEKTVSNIEEVKARRGIIVVIGPENDKELDRISDYYIPLNFKDLGELSPIFVNVATQLLAYYMAKFKGTDIDQPRNLAKSVTVE